MALLDNALTEITFQPAVDDLPQSNIPLSSMIDWTQFANCKGKTKLYFAPKAERPQARERREAKARALCNACMVKETCREFARENREYGLWGGENEEERHLAGYTIAAPIGVRSKLSKSA